MSEPTKKKAKRVINSFRLTRKSVDFVDQMAKRNGITKTAIVEILIRKAGKEQKLKSAYSDED